MATSPPASPGLPRPSSAMVKPAPRSNSRLSMSSKVGGGGGTGSRASDEDGGRTAVRVAVRVRPPLKSTDPGFDLIPQRFQRSMVQTTSNTGIAIDAPQGKKLFIFDRVFGPEIEQEGIWEYLQDSVNAFLQGYNVSLLAYGQSGAGKSYTMGTSGPVEQNNYEATGVIPRAAAALFEKLDGSAPQKNPNRNSMSQLKTPARYSAQSSAPKAEKNWQLKATYVEIYNEQLRDLLVPDHFQQNERGNVTIREDQKGNIILTGLQQVDINSVDDLMNCLNFGSTIRQTDATAINAKSSRSHAVFSLNLVQRKSKAQGTQGANKRFSAPIETMTGADTWVTTDSKLHFVDLAGSERLKNTGAQGERAKEGISINAGLAALGKVISQLSSRQAGSHVSYRDSRLTRLLQDSLGGNAITYMIACVTPAEFHLSETLNTVQYAQRARAIQSKPRIQQVEEGDKQAIIERLKAEVAFLREQIRSSERSGTERRPTATSERSERHNERESELQNQLLDTQESYNTLSQRHAKLIAEMARARDNEAAENQDDEETVGDTATERLKRSNSFAQAVEQVVLEYEKTIQTLEQSLTSTRATLSNTETSLLEKETKCAYIETINTQLQARLTKLMDREASTESYLHDLEAKLDGHTSGEEKNATIVLELRKEISRIRENESACEDYISTLEERLAESDQDQELMQREIDRLEQVIERQRSLGKLDSLLYELDHIHQDGKASDTQSEQNNGAGHRRTLSERSARSHASRPSLGLRGVLPEVAENADEDAGEQGRGARTPPDDPEAAEERSETPNEHRDDESRTSDYPPQSPAQTKFVADKLEDITEELVSLRVEHESTLNEYDALHAKYEEAMRTLAELQDQVDEAKHPNHHRDSILSVTSPNETRPSSFLSDLRNSDPKGGTLLSRSLSSELSSAMDSPTTTDMPETGTRPYESRETLVPENFSNDHNEEIAAELEKLKALAYEKEAAERELSEKYAQLEDKHMETLDMVEELKTQVAKAKHHMEPPSPRTATPVIRRKSSQNMMIIDRAHRSFATLRNIAAENFENQPDLMQSFEININAAMHELHARSERIQELEADVTTAKREMETKMTIIAGLTRERSSLTNSPMDISMVANLRVQLERNEQQLKEMQVAHATREEELVAELEGLRASINEGSETLPISVTQTRDHATDENDSRATQDEKIAHLEAELSSWEGKHQATLEAMQTTEQHMKMIITELETEVAAANAQLSKSREQANSDDESRDAEVENQNLVDALRNEINQYKSAIDSNAAKVAELEEAHLLTKKQLEEASKARDIASAESSGYQELVERLEAQIARHETAHRDYEEALSKIHEDHAKEFDTARARTTEEHEAEINMLVSEHAENIKLLEGDVAEARDELMRVATQVAQALGLEVSIEKISERIEDLVADQKALRVEQHKSAELEAQVNELEAINNTIMRDLEAIKSSLNEMLHINGESSKSPYPSVVEQLAAVKKRMTDLENKNKKHSRLVEELEDQLQTNYDQAQITNNRLSTLQTERNTKIEEANTARIRAQTELETVKEEMVALQVRIEELTVAAEGPKRTNSTSSQIRKTASVTSLPSPPPAIPLPPLPPAGATSPTQSTANGGRPNSHDLAYAQIHKDQEDRIQSIERHLKAERQLTSTLEEALTDLESQSKKIRADCEAWRKRAQELEGEVKELKEKPQHDNRWRDSLHQIEEERKKRQDAERARTHLEERMNAINNKKKKKGSLNCF
ncbi:kinesin motor domain-containing protein [Hypoxylon fragiforme]|uniref:kinesin motor domain-containing protein n=1 Tax=Hypoxylon fragiforme TaxID=63214 RepID=UPI0020C6A99A|nr:kinesin motor domain-containing protein [Hypoxylon fragiforme]KAI2611317.1 kinesin motor domain-containing protein [Hypoxylon fragiforme]